MSNMTNFEQQLDEALKAGNIASANRFRFIIAKEKRNAANRGEKQETRKRKAEDEGSGRYKAMRFSDGSSAPASMGVIGDMLAESHARDQADIKKREEERLKAERARKTAESKRKKAEYRAQQEAKARAERAEKYRKQKEEKARKDRARQERDEKFRGPPKSKPQPRAAPPPPRSAPRAAVAPPATTQQITTWRNFSLNCFADYSKILTFPAPPGGCCNKTACQAQKDNRVLEACDCNIQLAFRNAGATNYKIERLKWHPDKFGKCPEAKREELKKKAQEVFVVLEALHEGR